MHREKTKYGENRTIYNTVVVKPFFILPTTFERATKPPFKWVYEDQLTIDNMHDPNHLLQMGSTQLTKGLSNHVHQIVNPMPLDWGWQGSFRKTHQDLIQLFKSQTHGDHPST